MKQISNWITNNVFWITLIFILNCLFFQSYFLIFDPTELNISLYTFLSFDNVNLVFFEYDFFSFRINKGENRYLTINYLDYIFLLVFIVGLIEYKISKKFEYRLLAFCYSIVFISSALTFITVFIALLNGFEGYYLTSVHVLFREAFLVYLTFVIIKQFRNNIEFIEVNETLWKEFPKFKLQRSFWYQRLFHFVLDTFLIIALFSFLVFAMPKSWIYFLEDTFGDRFAATLLFVFFSSIYFMIFEGLFKSTPAKYLTNSSVVGLKSKRLTFENILGRALIRRLPFNAFSFLTKNGWHDVLAYTTVARIKEKETSSIKYDVIHFILLALILSLMTYSVVENM